MMITQPPHLIDKDVRAVYLCILKAGGPTLSLTILLIVLPLCDCDCDRRKEP